MGKRTQWERVVVFCRRETESKSVIVERACKKRVLPIRVARKCPLDLDDDDDDDDDDDKDVHS